jgi:hypothetical protein
LPVPIGLLFAGFSRFSTFLLATLSASEVSGSQSSQRRKKPLTIWHQFNYKQRNAEIQAQVKNIAASKDCGPFFNAQFAVFSVRQTTTSCGQSRQPHNKNDGAFRPDILFPLRVVGFVILRLSVRPGFVVFSFAGFGF